MFFTIFLKKKKKKKKKNRMTIKPLKIAAKIIFISRKINLNIQNLNIIPTTRKKCKFNMGVIVAVQYIYDMGLCLWNPCWRLVVTNRTEQVVTPIN